MVKIDPSKPTLVRMHQVDFACRPAGPCRGASGLCAQGPEGRLPSMTVAGVVVFLRDPSPERDWRNVWRGWTSRPRWIGRCGQLWRGRADPAGPGRASDMIVMSSTRPESDGAGRLWPAHRRLARYGWRRPRRDRTCTPYSDRRGALLRRTGRRPAGRAPRMTLKAQRRPVRRRHRAGRPGDPGGDRHGRGGRAVSRPRRVMTAMWPWAA